MEFFKNNISKEQNKLSGIYKITNLVNGKVYIGKTIHFKKRYNNYKCAFYKERTSHINEYFLNSIKKHGVENFTFDVIEECCVEDLAERELYWMDYYKSYINDYGYNLRRDTSTGMIVHEDTRRKISERVKEEYRTGIRDREKNKKMLREQWEDPERLEGMRRSLSDSRSSFFIQKDKEGEVVNVWSNINQVLHYNPGYKWQNIYAACNGNKKSYRGYLWERVDELEECYQDMVDDREYDIIRILSKHGKFTNYKGPRTSFFDKEGTPNKAQFLYYVTREDGSKMCLLYADLSEHGLQNVTQAFSIKKENPVKFKECIIEKVPFTEDLYYKDYQKPLDKSPNP